MRSVPNESETRYGYCDIHLGSKLIPYGSHLAGQYGGDKADCNPFEYWRCSIEDCTRCYRWDMFGYFNLDRQLGLALTRIRQNNRDAEGIRKGRSRSSVS